MTHPPSTALARRNRPTPGTMIGTAGLLLMLLGIGLPAQASPRARLGAPRGPHEPGCAPADGRRCRRNPHLRGPQ